MRAYPAALIPDPDGGFTVTFRDVPEAITEGDTREEALSNIADAIREYLEVAMEQVEPEWQIAEVEVAPEPCRS